MDVRMLQNLKLGCYLPSLLFNVVIFFILLCYLFCYSYSFHIE